MTQPSGSEPPGWVVWSSRASINAGTPSVTAIVETLIAVPVYWWLAIRFETYLPLLVSVCVAPLVLLRSDASVALGVRLFMAWERRMGEGGWSDLSMRERRYVWLAVIACATVTGVFIYVTAKNFIAGPSFWLGAILCYGVFAIALAVGAIAGSRVVVVLVGIGGAATIVTTGMTIAVKVTATAGSLVAAGVLMAAASVLTAFGMVFGVFLVSLAVRIFATLRHPAAGLRAMPDNFRRLVFCTSPLQKPELVPGLAEDETLFTFTNVLQGFQQAAIDNKKALAYLLLLPWSGSSLPGAIASS